MTNSISGIGRFKGSASMCQTEIDVSVNDEKEESTMEVSRVGVDLAKNVFQLHGANRTVARLRSITP